MLLQESLKLRQEMGSPPEMAQCLEGLALVAAGQGQPQRAVRWLAAADSLRATIGAPRPPVERLSYEATVQAARAGLKERAWSAAWAAGQGLTLDQAIAEALGDEQAKSVEASQPAPAVLPAALGNLTPREVEVLRLLAQGATDREIAAALSISIKTTNKHVASVLGKTGSANRTAAAAFALRHGIGSDDLPDRRPAEP